ncbi:MAG: CBS domain-containing protein, partial [Rhodospirillales bacterium]
MVDAEDNAKNANSPEAASEEEVLDLKPEEEQVFLEVLVSGDKPRVRELIAELHPSDAADLLEHLSSDDRAMVVNILRDNFDPDILAELDETVRDHVVDVLGLDDLASVIVELDSDDALEVVEELDEDEQKQVLDAIPAGDRTLIEEGLSYPEDSAGRLMQREVVTVPTFWNVGQTIDFMRQKTETEKGAMPSVFYDIFVVDPTHRPVGSIPISRLLTTDRPVPVTDLMEAEMKVLPVSADQEDVAFVFRQRDLVSAPVVDDAGRLIGTITIDDVVDVIHEEHE